MQFSSLASQTLFLKGKNYKGCGEWLEKLENFDEVNNVQVGSGSHSYKNDEKDQVAIIKHLMKSKVFHFLGERKHKAFKSLKTPITKAIKQKKLGKMDDR